MFWNLKIFGLKKEVKLVCFDLDNTLYDYNSAEAVTEVNIAKLIEKDVLTFMSQGNTKKNGKRKSSRGIVQKKNISSSPISIQTILKMFNDAKISHRRLDGVPEDFSRDLWFREMFEQIDLNTNLGISMNSLMKNSPLYEKKYWDDILKNAKLFPATMNVLKSLKDKNFKLALLTDSDGKKEIKMERIKKLGLDKYFDYVITSDDTGKNKPAKENWDYLLKVSGLKANECIMVGDHPEIDLITAKKLGFITVWTKECLNMDLHQRYVDYEIHDIGEVVDVVDKFMKKN